jgi:hypothetical protein
MLRLPVVIATLAVAVATSFSARVIGQPLDVLFNTGMLLGVGALKNGGRFDLAWLKRRTSNSSSGPPSRRRR